jgi:hypothetical protein
MKTSQQRKEAVDQASAEDSIKVGTEILSALGEQHRKYSSLEQLSSTSLDLT